MRRVGACPIDGSTASLLTMSNKSDRIRGAQDARQAFELLRARWPKAFPAKAHEVRPLASVTAELQEAFGWSPAYAKGVLRHGRPARAIAGRCCAYPNRVGLDGSPTEDIVDDEARAMATARLNRSPPRKPWPQRGVRRSRRPSAAARLRQNPRPLPTPPAPVEAPAPEPRAAKGTQAPDDRPGRKGGAGQARARNDRGRGDYSAAGAVASAPLLAQVGEVVWLHIEPLGLQGVQYERPHGHVRLVRQPGELLAEALAKAERELDHLLSRRPDNPERRLMASRGSNHVLTDVL